VPAGRRARGFAARDGLPAAAGHPGVLSAAQRTRARGGRPACRRPVAVGARAVVDGARQRPALLRRGSRVRAARGDAAMRRGRDERAAPLFWVTRRAARIAVVALHVVALLAVAIELLFPFSGDR